MLDIGLVFTLDWVGDLVELGWAKLVCTDDLFRLKIYVVWCWVELAIWLGLEIGLG